MVRSLVWSCCGFFGGCGTSVSSPFGVTGTITMKMIRSTSRTSISGVTLISDIACPVPPPPPIPIANLLILSAARHQVPAACCLLVYRLVRFLLLCLPTEGGDFGRAGLVHCHPHL